MPVTHEPWLVALSLIVAIQGAYVGLSLAVKIDAAVGARRRWRLAGAALSFGVAIWAMHFVAMLAARLPFPVDYLVLPTLLSFLVCVLVVGAAVFAVSTRPLTTKRLVAAALFMGLGIVSMHYIGMSALHASAHMTHDERLVAASVLIATVASGLALHLATRPGQSPLFLSSSALGLAIAGMHYTAMAAVTIVPHAAANVSAPALSTDLLAIIVAIVAFVVSGLFFLVLVPDHGRNQGRQTAEPVDLPDTWSESATQSLTHQVGIAVQGDASSAASRPTTPETSQPIRYLPVEHEGARQLFPVASVVAVQANAHYTYIFDGSTKHFCPLAISAVESRLDPIRFARVHRSHIVNIEHIARFRKAADSGRIELKGRDPYTVPVSRSRVRWVKSHLLELQVPFAV